MRQVTCDDEDGKCDDRATKGNRRIWALNALLVNHVQRRYALQSVSVFSHEKSTPKQQMAEALTELDAKS